MRPDPRVTLEGFSSRPRVYTRFLPVLTIPLQIVIDYEDPIGRKSGFWTLGRTRRLYGNASRLCAFRLMPLEPPLRPTLAARWSFTVIDPGRRIVPFKDESVGPVTSWKWDFGDNLAHQTTVDPHLGRVAAGPGCHPRRRGRRREVTPIEGARSANPLSLSRQGGRRRPRCPRSITPRPPCAEPAADRRCRHAAVPSVRGARGAGSSRHFPLPSSLEVLGTRAPQGGRATTRRSA